MSEPFIALGLGYHGSPVLSTLMALAHQMTRTAGKMFDCIATPAFKQDKSIIEICAQHWNKPVYFIEHEDMETMQPFCQNFSAMSLQATGIGSVAESCALAAVSLYAPHPFRGAPHLLVSKTIWAPFTAALAQNSAAPLKRQTP